MTLAELNSKFIKAHLLMAAGVMAGSFIARRYGIGHPIIFCGLTGLLFSLYVYRRCVCVLIDEYRRLKSKQ